MTYYCQEYLLLHMPAIKSTSDSAKKWVSRAGQAAGDYQRGVQNPRRNWQEATLDAEAAHEAGVQEAISNKSFAKGVQKAGNSKWQQRAQKVGAQRFGPGVAAAQGEYEAGFAPYASVIAGVQLPPRGPKGDPRNYERSKVIGDALHEAKVSA